MAEGKRRTNLRRCDSSPRYIYLDRNCEAVRSRERRGSSTIANENGLPLISDISFRSASTVLLAHLQEYVLFHLPLRVLFFFCSFYPERDPLGRENTTE